MLMDTIDAYIALRRAAGFTLTGIAPTLTRFGNYARQCGEDIVRADTAIAWASRGRSPERRETVLRVVAAFARHARAEDPRHEVPPTGVFGSYYRRPTPFIFSADQVRQLLEEARRLGTPASLRPHTYATLFGLLVATGLRISEALALRIDDLKEGGLHIRDTKFQKTRLVPVHPTVETALERYLERRRAVGGDTGLFFIGSDGRPLRYAIVHWTYNKLVRAIGLGEPGQPRPRLHCLRHTFAVRALERCPDGLPSITRHQVALMTYLGHSHVQHTYWYMQSTPHLLRGIANACEVCDGGGGR